MYNIIATITSVIFIAVFGFLIYLIGKRYKKLTGAKFLGIAGLIVSLFSAIYPVVVSLNNKNTKPEPTTEFILVMTTAENKTQPSGVSETVPQTEKNIEDITEGNTTIIREDYDLGTKEYVYDSNGNKIKETYIEKQRSWIKEYNENGVCTSQIDYFFQEDGTMAYYVITEVNEKINENVLWTEFYYSPNDKLFKIHVYNYDSKLKTISNYDKNEKIVSQTNFFYGNDNHYDDVSHYIVNEFDSNGNVIKSTRNNADGSIENIK